MRKLHLSLEIYMSKPDLQQLLLTFGNTAVIHTHSEQGDDTAVVISSSFLEIMNFLKDTLHYDFLVDLTAVDYLGRDPRFEVVYHLRAMKNGHRLRIKVCLQDVEQGWPELASVVQLWPAANWLEREVWDLYGIKFSGHPDLRRILLYEEFVGHPLRKDYPKEKRQPLIRRENLLPNS